MSGSPLQLAYKKLDVYRLSKGLAVACYALTHELPETEAAIFTRTIRTAALQAHIHIVQGAFHKKGKKKKKQVSAAKDGIIIIDAALEMLVETGLVKQTDADVPARLAASLFQLLQAL